MVIFGLQFHPYGLIIGLSIWLAIWLIQKKMKLEKLSLVGFDTLLIWILIGGILGARGWHVMTDWPLYQADIGRVVMIWEGGLSIIGAVLGGVTAAFLASRLVKGTPTFLTILDLAVFGLPAAQAVGRIANWLNQELYGLPSTLPWAIYIDPNHRYPGFETIDTYHPLFAYEMILMTVLAIGSWWIDGQRPRPSWLESWKLGSGTWFATYVIWYAAVRIGLDFLRLEKTAMLNQWLGLNQVILLFLLGMALIWLINKVTYRK